ncbi:hypothetical protein PMAYCL1PPCAC_01870 [Pristionchus mayeri]|uniref:Protein kinase domain-containing protein n=1 Tax=Pristionchus mayeri TaxID=1317129 RepID=A0AAN4Z5N2_9BILA|nr:hypothetical protein PMAYCL1PPCAC_01870 [Pristionchus mayeri]
MEEYHDEVERSIFTFLTQLETTQDYLKERAVAAFEFHTQLIDENIEGGVADFEAISCAFSSELQLLIANAEKVLQKTHDRLLEKMYLIIGKSERPLLFDENEDFVRPCREAVEAASEMWSSKLLSLEKALRNHRPEKRCKMLAEYRESHRPPEFVFTNRETMRITFQTAGIPRLIPIDETSSFRAFDIKKRVLLKRIYEDGGATEIIPVQNYHHRNILPCIGKHFHNGQANLMFPHLQESLQGFMEQQEIIKLSDMRELLTGLQQGLHYIHERGAFHGDLCPENIFIDKNCCCSPPTPKIADVGMCKTANLSGPIVIATDASKEASSAYKAPEAHRGEARTLEQLQKCDIYSFGLLVWSILTCRRVGEGLDEEQIEQKIQENSLVPPVPSGGSTALLSLLSSCWSLQPELRPTAAQLEKIVRAVGWPSETYEDSQWREEARLWRAAASNKII